MYYQDRYLQKTKCQTLSYRRQILAFFIIFLSPVEYA